MIVYEFAELFMNKYVLVGLIFGSGSDIIENARAAKSFTFAAVLSLD